MVTQARGCQAAFLYDDVIDRTDSDVRVEVNDWCWGGFDKNPESSLQCVLSVHTGTKCSYLHRQLLADVTKDSSLPETLRSHCSGVFVYSRGSIALFYVLPVGPLSQIISE